MVAGYTPQFLELPVVKAQFGEEASLKEAAIEFALYEVMVNAADIRTFGKLYFEIDCSGKRARLLDGILYSGDGSVSRNAAHFNRDFQFVSPDSNGELLTLLVCRPR